MSTTLQIIIAIILVPTAAQVLSHVGLRLFQNKEMVVMFTAIVAYPLQKYFEVATWVRPPVVALTGFYFVAGMVEYLVSFALTSALMILGYVGLVVLRNVFGSSDNDSAEA